MRTHHLASLLCFAALPLMACSKGGDASEAKDYPPIQTATTVVSPATQAKDIFATRCTPCHGSEGRGDGAASASLNPKPRNFHDTAWQSSVTNDYLTKIIQYGGAAVGRSPAMPANPDLRDGAVVEALALHVRGLGRNP